MKYVKKILELVSELGTPTFHSLLGQLIKTETKSTKIVILRCYDNQTVVLDAQDVRVADLEYDSFENALSAFELPNLFEFSFATFILCDGNFEDEESIFLLNKAFSKEEELFEKNRLMTINDRLSYQLSATESLVLNLSEPLEENTFLEIVQSSLSELLFGSVFTYKISGTKAHLFSKIGYLDINTPTLTMDEILLSSVEMGLPLFIEEIEEFDFLKQKKVKIILPIGNYDGESFLFLVVRDTKIEEEEKMFIDTIFKFIHHFFIKQFIEVIDFKQQLTIKTLKILHVFDSLLHMMKNGKNFEEEFIETIKFLVNEKISVEKYMGELPFGVYTSEEVHEIECGILIVYPEEFNSNLKKMVCIEPYDKNIVHKENVLEQINYLSLVLDSYETAINIFKK